MLKFIVMTAGYAENATTATLIYQCNFLGYEGYTSYKTAITDLALDLYAKYYEDYLSVYENRYILLNKKKLNDCCLEFLMGNEVPGKCSTCNKNLEDEKFDSQGFIDYIFDLYKSTYDLYGEAEGTRNRSFTWWPFKIQSLIGASKDEVIYIAENAELVLLSALLEARPELNGEPASEFGICDWNQFKNEIQPSY